jgi:hypothetical protein
MIKEVKEVSNVDEVNKLLKEGWKLLETVPTQPKATYVLGLSNSHK